MNIQSSTSKYQVSYGDGANFYTGGSRQTHTSEAIIQPNEWHQMVVVLNAAQDMKIYVDCIEYSGDYSGPGGQLQYSNLSGTIGRHDRSLVNTADYFKGVIDDFRYWNR